MRLVVTDTGLMWNHESPFLKEYKDAVLVVCLEGKKVTDDYECFVSPYKPVYLGGDNYGVKHQTFKALASVAGKLNSVLGYHEDIVFLADNSPSSLYPFCIIKELNKFNRLHLLAVPPFFFESKARINGYAKMLSDLSGLDSFLYYDMNETLQNFCKQKRVIEVFEYVRDDLDRMLPRILNGIHHMEEAPCYFDFASEEYVPLRDGFESIDIAKKDEDADINREVERSVARVDGKKVCNVLREQRIRLAAANNIPFESEECPSVGACAGTCEKCDKESGYLREQMQMIPEERRVYPQFDPAEEVSL